LIRKINYWLIFIVYLILATFFAVDISKAFSNVIILLIYILTFIIVKDIKFNNISLSSLIYSIFLGAFFSTLLTIVDFVGLFDFPRVNEGIAEVGYEFGIYKSASGTFTRRSAMGIYFALLIPLGIVISVFEAKKNIYSRLFIVFTTIFMIITILLTHNRASIISAFLSVFFIIILFYKTEVINIYIIIKVLLFLCIAIGLIYLFFPSLFIIYRNLLGLGVEKSIEVNSSDMLRVELFNFTINSLILNPIGNGLTLISGFKEYTLIDSHGTYTQFIWAGGLFGLIFYPYIFITIIRTCYLRVISGQQMNKIKFLGISTAILSWFFVGMAHTAYGIGLAWIFLGIMSNRSLKFNS